LGEVFDPSDLELFLIPICRGVVAVNDIDEWDDESASDYTIVRCANEEREASRSICQVLFSGFVIIVMGCHLGMEFQPFLLNSADWLLGLPNDS